MLYLLVGLPVGSAALSQTRRGSTGQSLGWTVWGNEVEVNKELTGKGEG